MKAFSWSIEEFYSSLAAAELMCRIQTSTLPETNDSWRDEFEVSPAQPFEGKISADSFAIARISVLRVRHTQPLIIQGWVRTDPQNATGSVLRLQYGQPKLAAAVAGSLCLLALGLAAWGIAKDWRASAAFYPWWVVYLLLPLVSMAVYYAHLRTEAGKVRPFLTKLLQLKPVVS